MFLTDDLGIVNVKLGSIGNVSVSTCEFSMSISERRRREKSQLKFFYTSTAAFPERKERVTPAHNPLGHMRIRLEDYDEDEHKNHSQMALKMAMPWTA